MPGACNFKNLFAKICGSKFGKSVFSDGFGVEDWCFVKGSNPLVFLFFNCVFVEHHFVVELQELQHQIFDWSKFIQKRWQKMWKDAALLHSNVTSYQIPTVSKALPQPPRRSLCGSHPYGHASPMPIVGVKPVMVACARSRNAWVKAHVCAGDWVVFTLHGRQAIFTVKYWHRHSLGFHLPSWVCQGTTCLLNLVS